MGADFAPRAAFALGYEPESSGVSRTGSTMTRARSTGWGNGEQRLHPRGVLIFNFDIGISQLKAEHRDMLHDWVVPWLKWRNSVIPIGLASRTGRDAANLHLSQMRASRTRQFLLSQVPDGFVAQVTLGFGEMKAKAEGYRDNTEDPRFRSVMVLFGRGPVAPFPPGLVDVKPELPDDWAPEGFSWDPGKFNDIGSGLSGFLELVPWEKVAMMAEYGDLFTAFWGAASAMPMLWRDVREQNENNGRLQGWWESFQDMADQFSDPGLSTMRMERWPELKPAKPRPLPTYDGSLNQREWMNGKKEACEFTYRLMEMMERDPPVKKHWAITGRRYLFLLSQKFGKNLATELHQMVDDRLRKKGNVEWPLRQ